MFSKCPTCPSGSFKATMQNVPGCKSSLLFIQCAACNTVVGVVDGRDSAVLIDQLDEKVDAISRRLAAKRI